MNTKANVGPRHVSSKRGIPSDGLEGFKEPEFKDLSTSHK